MNFNIYHTQKSPFGEISVRFLTSHFYSATDRVRQQSQPYFHTTSFSTFLDVSSDGTSRGQEITHSHTHIISLYHTHTLSLSNVQHTHSVSFFPDLSLDDKGNRQFANNKVNWDEILFVTGYIDSWIESETKFQPSENVIDFTYDIFRMFSEPISVSLASKSSIQFIGNFFTFVGPGILNLTIDNHQDGIQERILNNISNILTKIKFVNKFAQQIWLVIKTKCSHKLNTLKCFWRSDKLMIMTEKIK